MLSALGLQRWGERVDWGGWLQEITLGSGSMAQQLSVITRVPFQWTSEVSRVVLDMPPVLVALMVHVLYTVVGLHTEGGFRHISVKELALVKKKKKKSGRDLRRVD